MESSLSSSFGCQCWGSCSSCWSYVSLKNYCHISPIVRNHLKKVYLALCCALVASGVGVYLHILSNFGGIYTTFAFLASMDGVLKTPQRHKKMRVILLIAAGMFQGTSIGRLVELTIQVDPSPMVKSLVGCAMAFVCFSVVAMLAKRGQYLHLCDFFSSYGFYIMVFLNFAPSVLGGSAFFFKLDYCFAILVFVGYIVVDTQRIIEKAHLGDLDYMKDALTLFVDLAALFFRAYMFLLKNAADYQKKKKKKRGE